MDSEGKSFITNRKKINFLWFAGFLLLALASGSVFYGKYVSTRVAIIKTIPISRDSIISFNLPVTDYPKRLEICQGAINRKCDILADNIVGTSTKASLPLNFPLGEAYLKVSEIRSTKFPMLHQQTITVVITGGNSQVNLTQKTN